MKIAGLNEYHHSDISSNKTSAKSNNDTGVNFTGIFKSEVLNWGIKVKDRISRDLENDREKNINMSEKQWRALLNKVDNAINNQYVITDMKVDSTKPDDENKLFDDIIKSLGVDPVQDAENASFAAILKEKAQ